MNANISTKDFTQGGEKDDEAMPKTIEKASGFFFKTRGGTAAEAKNNQAQSNYLKAFSFHGVS